MILYFLLRSDDLTLRDDRISTQKLLSRNTFISDFELLHKLNLFKKRQQSMIACVVLLNGATRDWLSMPTRAQLTNQSRVRTRTPCPPVAPASHPSDQRE